ncbi:MAG: hypothetical protein N3A63_06310 [Bacteroidetes bacterium]|nr:hypothetical protein [Bacteroidota bacterium]
MRIYSSLFILSSSIICFEILVTRITSVIFVSSYAFIVLSFAILGLSCGAILSFYCVKRNHVSDKLISSLLLVYASTLLGFIFTVTIFQVTNVVIFFFLVTPPFVVAGILYAQVYTNFAVKSFSFYAADLAGASFGALMPLVLLDLFGAPNSVLLISLIVAGTAVMVRSVKQKVLKWVLIFLWFIVFGSFLQFRREILLPEVAIGQFPEKDFYYVYPSLSIAPSIVESRWSIYGRSDLVKYSHQDIVQYLFIDGAAGSPMYRFSGNAIHPERLLLDLLLHETTGFPFTVLNDNQKDTMLIIGPGGGKEVLLGLFSNIRSIIGVEVNPDFVALVKDNSNFNGGIYTKFSNVAIHVDEGRHYITRSKAQYDIIVISLPSTEQLQNVEALAANENYLLTVEAIREYFDKLTFEGQIHFTLHNSLELMRIIATVCTVLEERGITVQDALNHIAIVESAYYPPTVVVKRNPFTVSEISQWESISYRLPQDYPYVSYLPSCVNRTQSREGDILACSDAHSMVLALKSGTTTLQEYIAKHRFDISVCTDDRPFFYKVTKFIPTEFVTLLVVFSILNCGIAMLSFQKIRGERKLPNLHSVKTLVFIFGFLGFGFIALEVSLFQVLVLYMGTPTIALSILLCVLLLGMGCGSITGQHVIRGSNYQRIFYVSIVIVFYGMSMFLVAPKILAALMGYERVIRVISVAGFLLSFGFFLGIPFPSALSVARKHGGETSIPWLYGFNGSMTVLGSVFAMVCSMLYGFSISFMIGILLYGTIGVIVWKKKRYWGE